MIDVAIIGAGPYGLSLAAHLSAAGIPFRIFGETMGGWKRHMPPGMLLKSHPWSSCLYDPDAHYTLERFSAERGIDYHPSDISVPLETFIAYGEAFQRRFVPQVEARRLVSLDTADGGYRAVFEDGETVAARHVVLALGVEPFRHMPEPLRGLPPEFVSHSADYGPLGSLAGKSVAVIGSGASASGLAGLLVDESESVSLIAQADELKFAEKRRPNPSALRRMLRPIRALVSPSSGIGGGWLLKLWADVPWTFHALPQAWRLRLARTVLGPLGHSEMRERVEGRVTTYLGRRLVRAEPDAGGVRLTLADRSGGESSLHFDHVIAATGYRPDMARVDFLADGLRQRIRTVEGEPVLSHNYETSASGLYVIGPASAASFGPVARFVFGAVHPARCISRRLARTAPTPASAAQPLVPAPASAS